MGAQAKPLEPASLGRVQALLEGVADARAGRFAADTLDDALERVAVLAGLDPVPEMLAVAKDKLSGKEDLRIGYADSLPWNSGSFDLVVSCNMFHYITHPIDALREMARVLRPGGAIVLTDWCDDYLACRLCNLYLRLTNRAFYKTYKQAECMDVLHRAGFSDITFDRYKISWLWGLMTAVIRTGPG
jgi:ubiquinone/menaquinone biosynthesis C-methylase UbiE